MSTKQNERTYVTSMALLQQRGFTAPVYLDVGAAEGAGLLVRRQAGLFPGAKHFFIDAMQENEPIYKEFQRTLDVGYEIAALSCIEGEALVRIAPILSDDSVEATRPKPGGMTARKVPVRTLDGVCAKHSLEGPYVLRLDVQGAALDVLRGATKTLEKCVIVVAETELFADRDTVVDLLFFMQGRGFVLYDLTSPTYHPAYDAPYQCSATFIPKRLDFRSDIDRTTFEPLPSMLESERARRIQLTEAALAMTAESGSQSEAVAAQCGEHTEILPPPDPGSRWQCLPEGVRIATPESLDQMTTYVLEEQGDWFEDELRFVRKMLRGGESVLDVGANHGVFALSMAYKVGPHGRVVAIEPADATAARLRASAVENGFTHMQVLQCAISDHEGTAVLHTGASSELNSLGGPQQGGMGSESVRLTTLNACAAESAWRDIVFVKMDVEGEEIRALEGASALLDDDEPLWMLEHKHGYEVNHGLIEWLENKGHSIFRHVPGLDILVPLPSGSKTDGFLLNVFAARPARAALLEQQGLLARESVAESEVPEPANWRSVVESFPVSAHLGDTSGFGDADEGQARHRVAIERYGLSLREDLSPAVRWRCLRSAAELAASSIESPEDLGRFMTVARLTAALGQREIALEWLQAATDIAQTGKARWSEPFLPACPRFDLIDPGTRLGEWALACLMEQGEKLRAFSSYFTRRERQTKATLETIAGLGFQSPEMARRLALVSRT